MYLAQSVADGSGPVVEQVLETEQLLDDNEPLRSLTALAPSEEFEDDPLVVEQRRRAGVDGPGNFPTSGLCFFPTSI